MADVTEVLGYFRKLKKIVDVPELRLLSYTLVKKGRVDDLFCCILATLPDSFKATMKKRIPLSTYPSVSAFNRLSKVMKKTFFLSHSLYIFKTQEVIKLLQAITKHIENNVRKIEQG